jgi:hypothetical protein
MIAQDDVWAPLARPLLRRLDGQWQSESSVTAGLTLPQIRIFSAVRGGFAERRRHWLTRRWQIRLTVPGYALAKLKIGQGA